MCGFGPFPVRVIPALVVAVFALFGFVTSASARMPRERPVPFDQLPLK